MEQQPLFTPDRTLDLQSPVFQPRPGWGGQLAGLIKKIFSSSTFIIAVALLVVALTGYSLLKAKDNYAVTNPVTTKFGQIPTTAPTTVLEQGVFQETALAGQGVTHLARHALKGYLSEYRDTILSTEQKIYIEDYLRRRTDQISLHPGQTIYFNTKDIANAVANAKKLKSWQIANLTQYVKRVKS